MRSIFILLLLSIYLLPKVRGQEKNNGLEFNFSLVHPAKWSMQEYRYSVDPTLEVVYFFSLSKKILFSGGLFVQTGKHNWEELYGHTFYDDHGMPFRFRTDFNRRLEFFSLGIPVKFEIHTNNIVLNSLVLGFTAGNHLKLEKADYYDNKFVAGFPVFDSYNSLFWELNLGFRKIFYNNGLFTLSLLPLTGFRNESSMQRFAYYDYVFYGIGVSARLKK